MKLTTFVILRQLSFLAILFLLSTAVLIAQIKIREKIEISPKILNSKQVNSNSTTNTTIPLIFNGRTTRPCHITASGQIPIEYMEYRKIDCAIIFIYEAYQQTILYSVAFNHWTGKFEIVDNKTASFDVGACYPIELSLWVCGSVDSGWPGHAEINGNTITYYGDGGPNPTITATVTLTPIPEYELSTINMNANPTSLDANDDGSHESTIHTKFYNGLGNPFDLCWDNDQPLTEIKIENPLDGMTLTSYPPLSDGSMISFFKWDGSDLPNETYEVRLSATVNGVTATQTIELKKDVHPKVQIISPAQDTTIFVTALRQPTINLLEKHKPKDGMSEPTISWNPGKIIDTKNYYSQIQDTMSLTVNVTATNSLGEASDVRTVLLKKVEDVDHFDVTITPDSIFSNEYAQMSGVAIDKYDNETEIDDNTVINVSASPSENISYPNEVKYSDLKAGNIYLYLYSEEMPAPVQDFIFTVSWNEASGTGKLVVKQLPCIVLSVSPKKISPGEKAAITIQQLDFNGNLSSFPPDQIFSVWMNASEQYGTLRATSTGDSGPYLCEEQPFEFITADSIDVDSIIVEIGASLGGALGSIGIVNKDTLRSHTPVIMSKQTNTSNILAIPTEMNRKSIDLKISSFQNQLINESKKKGKEKQQEKLAMTIQQLKARLAYDTAKTPSEKQNAIKSIKQIAMLATETAECKSTDSITIKNDEGCIKVQNTSVSVGDTISLSFVYKPSGDPVPGDKVLNVSVVGAEGVSGTLLAGGSTGTSFPEALQPIMYIAPASISGDSLVVPIVASKSESGGGGGSTKIVQQKDSLKTPLAKISMTSPSILKALQSECQVGDVTVKKEDCSDVIFTSCNDRTSFEEIKRRNVEETWGDGGRTVPFPIGGEYDSYIHPKICYNESDNCYRLMIPEVSADLQIAVGGPGYRDTREVNSSNDIRDSEIALKVINDLTNLKKDIDRAISNYRKYKSPLYTHALIKLDQSKVHSSSAILVHEKIHADWWESIFKQAVENIKMQLPKCKSKDDFQTKCQVKDYFVSIIADIQKKYDKNVNDIAKEQLNNNEIKAHEKHRKFIDDLIADIKAKFF